jgi:hypothetical protein
MTDVELAQQFVWRKRLGPEWLSLAWLGIHQARQRYDASRGSWLTCARVGMAGVLANERRKQRYRQKYEESLECQPWAARALPDQEHWVFLGQCERRLRVADCEIVRGLWMGETLKGISLMRGKNPKWASSRMLRLQKEVSV